MTWGPKWQDWPSWLSACPKQQPFSIFLNSWLLPDLPVGTWKPPAFSFLSLTSFNHPQLHEVIAVMVPEGTECWEEWLLLVDGVQLRLRVTAGALEDRTVTWRKVFLGRDLADFLDSEGQKVPCFIDGTSTSFGFVCGSMAWYGNNPEPNINHYAKAIWYKRDARHMLQVAANAQTQSILYSSYWPASEQSLQASASQCAELNAEMSRKSNWAQLRGQVEPLIGFLAPFCTFPWTTFTLHSELFPGMWFERCPGLFKRSQNTQPFKLIWQYLANIWPVYICWKVLILELLLSFSVSLQDWHSKTCSAPEASHMRALNLQLLGSATKAL